MTQEEQNLLIRDLCGRLPYGVKIKEQDGDYTDVNIHNAHIEHLIDRVGSGLDKMVLRPLSSMTKEEEKECVLLDLGYWDSGKYEDEESGSTIYIGESFQLIPCTDTFDYFDRKGFDYRGLIKKGLAVEETEESVNRFPEIYESTILSRLGNNEVQDILEEMGMIDDDGNCPYTAEEIFKAGIEYTYKQSINNKL